MTGKKHFGTGIAGLFVALLATAVAAGPAPAATDLPTDPGFNAYLQALQAQTPYYGGQRSTAGAQPSSSPSLQPSPQAAPMPTALEPAQPRMAGAPLWDVISELRFGILSHDVRFPSRHEFHAPNPFDNRYEDGVNLNPEVVFISPEMLDFMGAPRPHVGISVNAGGDTSSLYTGLGWDTSWDNGIFLEGFFGMAVHDGKLTDGNPDNVEFGSTAVFRLGGDVGWRWDDVHGVSLVWEHMSNAGVIDEKNQGIDSLGLRYGYRFSN